MATEAELRASGEFWDPGYQAFIASGFYHPSWAPEAEAAAARAGIRPDNPAAAGTRQIRTAWGEDRLVAPSGVIVSGRNPEWMRFVMNYNPSVSTNTVDGPTGGQTPMQVLPAQQGGTNPIITAMSPVETQAQQGEEYAGASGISRRTMILAALAVLAVIGVVIVARRGKGKPRA